MNSHFGARCLSPKDDGGAHRRGRIRKAHSALHKYIQCAPYRFISKQNGYLLMNHLFYYEPTSPDARITIKAIDPYGHIYTGSSSEIITAPFANFAHYYKSEKLSPQ